MRRRSTILDRALAPGLYTSGAIAAAAALGLAASSGLELPEAALLIIGCDLIVAALAVGAQRLPQSVARVDLASLLSGAIADGAMTFAISAAAIIALFGNSKSVERLGYFLALLVILPLCVTLAWRRQRAGSSGERQRFVAFATLAATAAALVSARAIAPLTASAIGASQLALAELLAARAAIELAARLAPARVAPGVPAPWALAAAPLLLLVSAAACLPAGALNLADILIPLALALGAFCVVDAHKIRRLPRALAHASDAVALVLATLVVFYVGPLNEALTQNQNYFLGPALDVVHGHPMLVSTFSQYGVGMIYALVAVFMVVPIGYGTFTLLLAALTVLLFAVVYIILRWSTGSLLVAAIGLAAVVVLDMFGQAGFYTYFPSTGVLRFGLPWLVIMCSLGAARTEHRRRWYDATGLAVVAVAVVWSGEAGAYCLGTASVLACLDAALIAGSARQRMVGAARRVALLVIVSAASLLAFTLVMRVATGVWPEWAGYLEYIRLYTVGNFGALPILPWSPGLAIGGMYTISAIAIVLLVMTRPALVRERAVAFRAAAGLTALGTLVYTYFLGRSHPNNLIHVSPPAVALLFVWFDIARATLDGRKVVAVASSTAVFIGALIVVGERQNIEAKYPNTALAAVLGDGAPVGAGLQTLWRNPVVEPSATHIVDFVKSLEGERSSLTLLVNPNIETEVLLRLGVANAVGSSNPAQEAISKRAVGRMSAAVSSLQPGGIVVVGEYEPLLEVEEYALSLLRRRFNLERIASDGNGLVAMRTRELQ